MSIYWWIADSEIYRWSNHKLSGCSDGLDGRVLVSTAPRTALWPTQLRALSSGVKRQRRKADHLHVAPTDANVKNAGGTPPLPHTCSWLNYSPTGKILKSLISVANNSKLVTELPIMRHITKRHISQVSADTGKKVQNDSEDPHPVLFCINAHVFKLIHNWQRLYERTWERITSGQDVKRNNLGGGGVLI
jgi:hypothetical protein